MGEATITVTIEEGKDIFDIALKLLHALDNDYGLFKSMIALVVELKALRQETVIDYYPKCVDECVITRQSS